MIALSGLCFVKGFMGGLSNQVPAPPNSQSRTARLEYDASFSAEVPVSLSVLVTPSDGTTPLINRSAQFEFIKQPPFYEYPIDTPLSEAAANTSQCAGPSNHPRARRCRS